MEERIFYRLKNPRSARVEGHVGKLNVFFIFAILFTVLILASFIYTFATGYGFQPQSLLSIFIMLAVCTLFLVLGIRAQLKYNRANEAERKLLNDCLCTDGIITQCRTNERVISRSGESDTYYYDVSLSYSFYNDRNEPQYGTFEKTYNYDPEFYEGQWVMVAFNQSDSAILGKFSFIKEDEEIFLNNEAARSLDDFDELDGEPVEIDVKSKIQSAEFEYAWFWAAFSMFVFLVLYTVPMSIFGVPNFVSGKLIPDIFIYLIIYFMPAVLSAVIIYTFVQYVKKKRTFKKILNNQPSFVWGKIFASEKTYRSNARKKVFYCYVDADGGRHTKSFSGSAVRKVISGRPVDVAVMYDKNGNSVPLYNYKFTDEE